jgi:N,N'-diacetyllegionaminate synthase
LSLIEHCRESDIEFMSTPFDEEAADFLVSLGMQRIKVSSAEITNHPFLAHLARFDVPLILSTGMATLEEVRDAVDVVSSARLQKGYSTALEHRLTLLHCTSNYPAGLSDVNLRAMQTLHAETGLPVGYSDHTAGILVAAAAVAMGASVIEKHFTLDRAMEGPDHRASLEPDDFARMVAQIRDLETAMGSAEKAPVASELPVRDLVRRSIVVNRSLGRGERVAREDVVFLRPGTGIPPSDLNRVLGMTLTRSKRQGEMLRWDDLDRDA